MTGRSTNRWDTVATPVGRTGETVIVAGSVHVVDGVDVVVGVSRGHGWMFVGVRKDNQQIVSCAESYRKAVNQITIDQRAITPISHRSREEWRA